MTVWLATAVGLDGTTRLAGVITHSDTDELATTIKVATTIRFACTIKLFTHFPLSEVEQPRTKIL